MDGQKWFLCDPRKNAECGKTICAWGPYGMNHPGRGCRLTTDPESALDGAEGMTWEEVRRAWRPRVLTPEEIRHLPRGSVVWVEYFSGETGSGEKTSCAMKCGDGSLVDEEALIYDDFEKDMTPDEEGDCWRFWSAEPTPEERRTEPWPLRE